MSKLVYEAIAKAGKYTDRNGDEKMRFHKCGVVFESDKGLSLKLESLPIGFDGWLSLKTPLPKDGQRSGAAAPAAAAAAPAAEKSMGDDDDIPF